MTNRDADRVVIEQSTIDSAVAAIRTAFGPGTPAEEHGIGRLIKRIEEILDVPREQWPPSALRAFWEPLRDLADQRARSPRHESRWFNLAGYCLRPGTGFPLDELRLKALWPTFHQGVKHVKDVQCWVEWWVLWRRVAAGLSRPHHEEIARRLVPFLLPQKGGGTAKKANRPRPESHEVAEMWRCAASLERINAELKASLGQSLARELPRPPLAGHVLWCLGRLGARVPLYGPANTTVPRETVEPWLNTLIARDDAPGRESIDALFALGQLGRVSGDRVRDVDPDFRARTLDKMTALGASDDDLRPVREYTERESAEQGVALGDALPVGLRLIREPDQAGA